MRHLLIGIGILSCAACVDLKKEDPEVTRKLIEDGLAIRMTDFRSSAWVKCQEEALETAIIKADSIIRARARSEAVDYIPKPPKPERPVKPPTRELPDSLRRDSLGGNQ